MLALSFNGVEHVEVVERRTPRIKDDMDVIVRVTTTAISSRDLARYTGHDPAPGTIPGAEFCGLVDEVGAGVSAVDLGDLVTGISVFDSENGRQGFGWDGLDGGQALYVRVPFANDTLLKVPTAGIEERALLLGDTYGLGASAAAQATSSGATDICVIGFDPYGASALIALAASGITDVIGLDDEERRGTTRNDEERRGTTRNDEERRLGLAHRLGAITFDTSEERVEDAVREATGGSGFGAVVVGAGLDATQIELGLRLLQPDGVMALTEPDLPGWSIPALAVDERGYRQLHAKERGANKILLKI